MESIGLIAGNGKLPLELVKAAQKAGCRVLVAAVGDTMNSELSDVADAYEVTSPGELQRVIDYFKDHGISRVAMAGKVSKEGLYKGVKLDSRFITLLSRLKNVNDDSLLIAIADELISEGIFIEDQTRLLRSLMPVEGVLTNRIPTDSEDADIRFGFDVAKQIGRLDIGQTVVVKNKAVLAVEAIEGTDECIRRGGRLGRGGAAVVKVAKPNQDLRFDVPTVGEDTLNAMVETGASILAIEAEKTFVVDMDRVLGIANSNNIAIVSIRERH
jgi:DUF1009 family protein